MLIRKFRLENVRSFLELSELKLDNNIGILVGPNGGGKTNLLDSIVILLRKYIFGTSYLAHNPTPEKPDRHEIRYNDQLNQMFFEKHSASGSNQRQYLEITLEITEKDVQNMELMRKDSIEIENIAQTKYMGLNLRESSLWNFEGIKKGARFSYTLENGSFNHDSTQGANEFLQYLRLFEIYSRLRDEYGYSQLAWPMIYLPVNRNAQGFSTEVQIFNFNEGEQKRTVDATSSRYSPSIGNLVVGKIAEKFHLLLQYDDGNARQKFKSDENLTKLSKILSELGYEWELDILDFKRSHYGINLKKQGTKFSANFASSGEKEILLYLFTIYGLNIRDSLIIVDEPELHLHPRWQKILLKLFDTLANETGNQFLFATHSPTFISPNSIEYVSRVYIENQQSKIHPLSAGKLPNAKHLFNIINSQDNEKLFFADRVILVEGATDRIFFEKVFETMKVGEKSSIVYEIVDVGGKGMFKPYCEILKSCAVPYSIIADLDYIEQVGSAEVRNLLKVDENEIKEDVIDNVKSLDGESLVAAIEEAIESSDWANARYIWEFIKSKRRRLRGDLNKHEEDRLGDSIKLLQAADIYILKLGPLESYIPARFGNKDIGKLIEFINGEDFWNQIDHLAKVEIEDIVAKITL